MPLVIILALSFGADLGGSVVHDYDLVQLIPYLIVLIGGIAGVNVFVVLLLGILSGSIIMVATGATAATDLLANMGTGAAGMFETTMVALLVSAICALIREHGGFVALLNGIQRLFKGRKGGQLGMGLLVGAMDIATANNTVAIVISNPIAADMAKTYGISKRKTASLLDTFFLRVPGHPALRRADARGHLRRHRARLRRVGVPDHPVSVLPLPAAHQLARVHLPHSGQKELSGRPLPAQLVQITRIVGAPGSFALRGART